MVDPKHAATRLQAMLRTNLKGAEPIPGDPDHTR